MLKSKIKPFLCTVMVLFLAAFFLGCVTTEEPKMELAADGTSVYAYITEENDYKNWEMWPGKEALYPRSTDKPSEPHGDFITTYVSEDAHAAIEGKRGVLPDGSIVVKENHDINKTLASITVMYKRDGYDPDHNDWFWAKYSPDGKVSAEGKVQGCIDCHGQMKEDFQDKTNDYIWTEDLR